ncbi:hypothetical protein [Flavobacterium macacae]|uniref:Uncharacterized protein n=1 Tax=Flavobacterium macacae TaxID=2488993 RepID=A0A3P3WDX2_9FLAO|nr:hypothetical protein [Flavobacterium macacae]RRJ90753.1 hypothetical protein EG849_09760 [Flavobacterium macacae]
MNTTPKITSIIIIFLLLCISCKSQTIITKVSYISAGMGGYEIVQVTKDSVIGKIVNRRKKIFINEKTQKKFWNSLIQSMTVTEFQEVKPLKRVQDHDEENTTIKIETTQGNYSLLNGDFDPIKNKKVLQFVEILQAELNRIYLEEKDK